MKIFNDYKNKIKSYLGDRMLSMPSSLGKVAMLNINGKYIYLWQDAKGQVCYSFDIYDKEYFTTSAAKLGNVLAQHFKCEIEVVNNEKEHLKKLLNAQTQLNKSMIDFERYNGYTFFSNHNYNNSDMNMTVIYFLIYQIHFQVVFLLSNKTTIAILYKIKKSYIMVLYSFQHIT